MKKIALSLALGAALIAGSIPVQAQDIGQDMVIYGRLQTAASGCTVLMSKYVLTLHHENEKLPVQGSDINPFNADDHVYVQLGGKSCDADEGYKNIGLKFLGTADSIEGNTLANTDTSSTAAQGVGIQMTDMKHNLITPNVTIATFPSADKNGEATNLTASFPLYLSLVSLKGQQSTQGNVSTNLTVQIERL
ncbi:type 1 fimbrial protein [Cronobacter dublinensis]|uniref:fimbrial protein n=1 Tax=Cronobacter muytjensii TaxID=413501 RepID=UPI001587FC81|nr:fimbrial protein [Cronobacter muytjensii]ELY2857079.1 type 1 fimbrial protein [Cronobacter dublinensis]NUW59752.1 type 1 fimbrial protein [Cronobacter muytjensii]